jgi:uncharacterized protein YceH (UPF0502 family)
MIVETEKRGLVRDTESKALLNTDMRERDRIQMERAKMRRSVTLETRVAALEKQVAELKEMILNGNQV